MVYKSIAENINKMFNQQTGAQMGGQDSALMSQIQTYIPQDLSVSQFNDRNVCIALIAKELLNRGNYQGAKQAMMQISGKMQPQGAPGMQQQAPNMPQAQQMAPPKVAQNVR